MTEPGLAPCAFSPLPPGAIRPAGWLLTQLRIQADGLSRHLDEFWADVAESGWIGGRAEGWERGPYWLDGIVPLAFLLNDPSLQAKARRWVEYILDHQQPDGWLGPIQDTARGRYRAYDPWPVTVALKALTQYHEATGEARILPAMARFFRKLQGLLAEQPLFDWGKSRWADLVLSLHWLYDRTAEAWLLDLARTVRDQGYDWKAHFEQFQFKSKMPRESCTQITHVVNNAMAVKQPGVWSRQSRHPTDRTAVFQILDTLDTYHGQATGLFTGDEHYAGRNPSQGTELCAVVEYLFSLEVLLSVLGDPALADRLERIAFNALPATFKPDMWAHQYDQQANQVVCRVSEDRVYTNNGPRANLFGLEPNYGCCTANMHQGWPKFAAHLWMRSPDGGLAAVALAPCTIEANLDGAAVCIDVQTDYPFSDTLRLAVHTDRPKKFPLRLRIPAWAEGAQLTVEKNRPVPAVPGTFCRIEREWTGTTVLSLRLPMSVAVRRGYHNSVSVERGPLVYALALGEDWRQIDGQPPHADWEVHPTTPWNYALELDPEHPAKALHFEPRPVGSCPFSPEGAPIRVRAKGRRVPGWTLEHNAAGPPPESPVSTTGPPEDLPLIPYGCTNLRVTEFPLAR